MTNLPPEKIDDLIDGVHELQQAVDGNAAELAAFRGEQARKNRANRRTNAALAVVIVLLAAFFVRYQMSQNCRNHHSDAFNVAERQKVCGQVKGIAQIVPQDEAHLQRIAVECGGIAPATPPTVDPVQGVNHFEDTSLDYVASIEKIGSC